MTPTTALDQLDDVLDAHNVANRLRWQLEKIITEQRDQRGEVSTPEDTWVLIRSLQHVLDQLQDYSSVFKTLTKEVSGHMEDELITAQGEDDGIPRSGMTVVDTDGTTIKIKLDTSREWLFDVDQLIMAVAAQHVDPADAIRAFVALGTFKPQITKVQAFSQEVGVESPDLAAVVRTSTHRGPVSYNGVKSERISPKLTRSHP